MLSVTSIKSNIMVRVYDFVGGSIGQYLLLGGGLVTVFLASWLFLSVLKRLFLTKGQEEKIFRRFQRHFYLMAGMGSFLYVVDVVFSSNSFMQDFWVFVYGMKVLYTFFVFICLLALNSFLDVLFGTINRKLSKAHWDKLGILQLFKGVTKVVLLSFASMFLSSMFVSVNFLHLLRPLSFGAGTITAVVAFASKDLVSNFFGALVVTLGRPFVVGDWIVVDKMEGRVLSLSMRSVHLSTKEGVIVHVPNSTFISKHVRNYGGGLHSTVNLKGKVEEGIKAEKLDHFWEAAEALLESSAVLSKEKSKLELSRIGTKEIELALHLHFKKISEREKAHHLCELVREVSSLGKKSGMVISS